MKPIFSPNSTPNVKFRRGRLVDPLILMAITAGIWTIDRLAAAYAMGLTPMAPLKPLLGDWLFAQRVDHLAPAMTPFLLSAGIFLLFGTLALEAFPEFPLRRLAQLAFICAAGGLLANSTSLLLQNGVVMDFLTINAPTSGLAHTLFLWVTGQIGNGQALPVLHFVPADLAQWISSLLVAIWGLTVMVSISLRAVARARRQRRLAQI